MRLNGSSILHENARLPQGQNSGRTADGGDSDVGLRPLAASTQSPVPWSEAEQARLESALKYVDAKDYQPWLEVGFVLHDLAKNDAAGPVDRCGTSGREVAKRSSTKRAKRISIIWTALSVSANSRRNSGS